MLINAERGLRMTNRSVEDFTISVDDQTYRTQASIRSHDAKTHIKFETLNDYGYFPGQYGVTMGMTIVTEKFGRTDVDIGRPSAFRYLDIIVIRQY